MSESDAMAFYNQVTDSEPPTESYKISEERGHEVEIKLTVVDRKELLDEINRLPESMLAALSEAEDEDEAQELAEEENMLSNVNGDTITAFENICAKSIKHPEWTSHHVEDIVEQLSFETLFEAGSKVIEMSFEETGAIKDFQKVDSDKNS